MNKEDLKILLNKVDSGLATDAEEQLAQYWLHYSRRNHLTVLSDEELTKESDLIYEALMKRSSSGVISDPMSIRKSKPRIKKQKLWFVTSAASAAAILIIGFCLWSPSADKHEKVQGLSAMHTIRPTIAPGIFAATLTLADGTEISLSEAPYGVIAHENGISIRKAAGNMLVYSKKQLSGQKENAENNKLTNSKIFNTLSTVKGQQYQVILPDGSRVWLNAASSITYPPNFANQKTRSVRLSGEGYFEVSKDKKHPFVVETDQQRVEVLGTHFNINSYKEEGATKTTLLEGSVKVLTKKDEKVLLPGQQSRSFSSEISVDRVDVKTVVGWKNGDFVFTNDEFGAILRQISRWYNVEIDDQGQHQGLRLTGTISRSKDISVVLKALEVAGKVTFKIEGKKLIVTK